MFKITRKRSVHYNEYNSMGWLRGYYRNEVVSFHAVVIHCLHLILHSLMYLKGEASVIADYRFQNNWINLYN